LYIGPAKYALQALKRLLLLAVITAITSQAFAQSIIAHKNYGGSGMDVANDVRETMDGGLIIAGISYSRDGDVSNSNGNAWVVKLGGPDTIQWEHCYINPLHYANPQSIIQTADSGYVIAGNATTTAGVSYCFITKLDDTGTLVWQRNIDSASYYVSIRQTMDNGFIVGTSANAKLFPGAHGLYDLTLMKLDSMGSTQWIQTYGGPGDDHMSMLRQTSDGGYIMAGERFIGGATTGQLPNTDYFVVKTNSVGIVEWQKNYGGFEADIAYDILPSREGGYMVVGMSRSVNGDVTSNHSASTDLADVWLLKLDTVGKIQWQKTLGGSGNDVGYSLIQVSDGDYVLAGMNASRDGDVRDNHMSFTDASIDCWVVKLSPAGTITWTKSIGGTDMDYVRVIREAKDGNYILAGHSYSSNGDIRRNYGQSDYLLLRMGGAPNSVEAVSGKVSLSLYPNPTSGKFTLNTPERGTAWLMNLQGQQVAEFAINPGKTELQLPALMMPGMYMIRFEDSISGATGVVRLMYQL
jgi:hypothetical protein